jgi:outer membrane protein insertion porin family
VVFASAARLGLGKGFEQELIPSERFFAGGGYSVRGYAEDALSPQSVFGAPVGGDALLTFNEELRFPVVWRVRGVAFFDAGRAFPTIGEVSLAKLRSSVGFGARVDTPFALLRIDFGAPINRQPDERRGRWFFSIGQAF